MKSAKDIQPANAEEGRLREFDLREIDAPDQRTHFALKYLGRLEPVLRAIRRYVAPGGLLLEVGSAQANASLLLAEEGYQTIALDLVPEALGYARKKHERGRFMTVCASAGAPPIGEGSCDGILVGELLEHCARPAEVLRALAGCLTDRGVIVITTPNGERWGSTEPTYSRVTPEDVEARQFGPGGEDHLFAFTLRELIGVAREAGLELLAAQWHATMLHSDKLMPIKRLLSPSQLRSVSRLICRLPVIGPKTALTLLVVAARRGK